MALPSSSSNGLRVFPGELAFNRVATNPLEMEEAAASGRKFTQDLLDDGIVRPKKRAAEAAEADLKKTQSVADQSLVPTMTTEKRTAAEAQTEKNKTETILRAVQRTVVEDPVFQKRLAQNYVNEQHAATNTSAAQVIQTAGALDNANTVADTETSRVNTANSVAAVNEARTHAVANVNTAPEALDQVRTQAASANTVATGDAQIAAAPFVSEIRKVSEQGAQAKAVDTALQHLVSLASTQVARATGPVSPASSQEAAKIRAEKAKDVSDLTVKLREDASFAESKLQKFEAFKMLMGTNVSTGYLHGTKFGKVYDGILAQAGYQPSAIRTQMAALQALAVPDMARGLGQMSNQDVVLFKEAIQGPDKTSQVNAALLTAYASAAQRMLDKRDFYGAIISRSSVQLADESWSSYINSNPIFDAGSSNDGRLVLNQQSLSPEQYRAAIQSPGETANRIMPTGDAVNRLPLGDTEEQLNALSPTIPFAAVTSGNTTRVVATPKYWLPIIKLHKKLIAESAGGVDSSDKVTYQNALTKTPAEQAVQIIPSKASPQPIPPIHDIRRISN